MPYSIPKILVAPAVAICLALVASAVGPSRSQAQIDYRSASPRRLVEAWTGASRLERSAIADTMAARRSQVLPSLRSTATTGDRDEKLFACSMIAELRDHDGIDALLAASADTDFKVRRRAATALRILADRRSVARLREIARSEEDTGALMTTLAAIGRIGLRRDRGLVRSFLAHQEHGIRVIAAGALAMLGDEQAIDLVLEATHSDNPSVQKSATYALGLFAADVAGVRLQEILDDPFGAWKSYAVIAAAERRLAQQAPADRVQALGVLAQGRSRTAAEWAVERLTDIGGTESAAILRKVQERETPVARKAARRLLLIEARP